MLFSRKLATAFAGVFLIGAAVGGLVAVSIQDTRLSQFLTRTGDPKSMAEHINQKYVRDYNLTADEQARIAPLTEEMAQSLYLSRRRFGVDIISIMDDYHRKIGEQMIPEHRQAFQTANEERRKRMSSVLLLDSSSPDADPKQ